MSAAATLALLASGISLTPPANPDYIETAWIVQADASQTGSRSVRDGDYVLKQRLLPATLVELQSDAVEPKSGEIIARAGDQLFGVLTSGPPVYCVSGMPNQSIMRSMLIGTGNVQRCMIDSDNNGSLDGHFGVGNAVPGLPNFVRKKAKKPKPLSGGAFRQIDPALDKQNYFVGIRFEGTVGMVRKDPIPNFSIRFGTDANMGRLTADARPENKSFPFGVDQLGARFEVLSRDGDVIQTIIDQAIPAQRFGVVMTVVRY